MNKIKCKNSLFLKWKGIGSLKYETFFVTRNGLVLLSMFKSALFMKMNRLWRMN